MDEYIRRKDAYKYLTVREPWKLDGDDIHTRITSIPSADVAPVRRGKWERCFNYDNYYWGFRCSACGIYKEDSYSDAMDFNYYCPNCGARMEDVIDV